MTVDDDADTVQGASSDNI